MSSATPSTFLFLLDNVPDRQRLTESAPAGTTVVYLDSTGDALAEIADTLAALPAGSVGAAHLVSHGSSGSLSLGSLTLNSNNLGDYADTLARIGNALSADADLLLYGCNVAAGEAGQAFIDALATATGADVAASDDLTGNIALGGDGVLERSSGEVEAQALDLAGLAGVLGIHIGGPGVDIFIGNEQDDTILGMGGDDSVTGNAGNDTLDGGAGTDTANYNGFLADYRFEVNASGQITIDDTYSGNGDDGTDTLISIERASFVDGTTISLAVYMETPVNTTSASDQSSSAITALTNGGYIVTWMSTGLDANGYGIYAQRYNAIGDALGAETRVNTFQTNDQRDPTVTALANGAYVITWTSDGQDADGFGIYAQRYLADGTPDGSETQINTTVSNSQAAPTITTLTNGSYVITWRSNLQDSDSYGIFARHYNADGTAIGGETQVNTYVALAQRDATITALKDGGYVITWTSYGQDTDSYGIFAQRYNAAGTPAGGETQVNTQTTNSQSEPAVTALNDGGYVIAWQSNLQDGDGWGIYAQRYDATGAPVGNETLVNTYAIDDQSDPAMATLADGGYVISWTSTGQDGSGDGIYAQRYDANGIAVGAETRVNTYTTGDQSSSAITALDDGGYVISWTSSGQDGSSNGIYAQRYDANGNVVQLTGDSNANSLYIRSPYSHTDITLNGGTGNDQLNGSTGDDALAGGDGDDYLNGYSGNDILVGGEGDDEIWGDETDMLWGHDHDAAPIPDGTGNDSLCGGDGKDSIYADGGDDYLDGGGDDDFLYGGNGSDVQLGGEGNDTLDGSFGDDSLLGGDGNDHLTGWNGDDHLDGGDGTDTAAYAGNRSAYHLLKTPAGYTLSSADGTDTLVSIENLQFADGAVALSDLTAPTLQSASPADGATAVAVGSNLSFTFNEVVFAGFGTLTLKTAAGVVVETFDVASSARLTFAGATLTIDPTATLANGAGYVLEFSAGAVTDAAGNAYAGWAGYDFTTVSNTPEPPEPPTLPQPPVVTDSDGDGVANAVENLAPGLGDSARGDGNGDGLADAAQANVASAAALLDNASPTYLTLATGSGSAITHFAQLEASVDLPDGLNAPLGGIGFEVTVDSPGATETFSLYADDDLAINGYWKQEADGDWVNLASAITYADGKVRVDFSLTDGVVFDADGLANGTIVDPGVLGYVARDSASPSEQISALYMAFYNRAPDAAGLAYWVDTMASGATLQDIATGFEAHTRFSLEYAGLSNNQIAAKFYTNVLGQSGDAGGLACWSAQLDAGQPVYKVIADFVGAALNADLLTMFEAGSLTEAEYAVAYQRQTLLDNKVYVAQQFVELFGAATVPQAGPTELSGDTAYNAAIAVLDDLTCDPACAYALADQFVTLVGTTNPMQEVIDL